MKFYGHANLQQNELQNAVLSSLTTFPPNPAVGQLAFINNIVYICVGSGGLPVWVPLTREITAYTHVQAINSATWNIAHGLASTAVNIQIFDGSNRVIIPNEIEVIDGNNVQVTFGTALGGRAVVVSGHFDGNVRPTYAYTHFQSVSSTTWVINHALGYNPIVRIFIGNNEVQPATVVHNNTNQTTISFTTAQVGYARLI